jgi:hypothetical protein
MTEDVIIVMLIDREREVLWRAQGSTKEQAVRDLRVAVAGALSGQQYD